MSDPPWASAFDSCAIDCLVDAIQNVARCSDVSDTSCFCDSDKLQEMIYDEGVATCIYAACPSDVVAGKAPTRPRGTFPLSTPHPASEKKPRSIFVG